MLWVQHDQGNGLAVSGAGERRGRLCVEVCGTRGTDVFGGVEGDGEESGCYFIGCACWGVFVEGWLSFSFLFFSFSFLSFRKLQGNGADEM